MYIPDSFKCTDQVELDKLLQQYPFATAITTVNALPLVTLLPLVAERVDNQLQLYGHMARANAHWQFLGNGSTMLVFQGAHAYITPQWYERDDVPTWNYSVACLRGKVTLLEKSSEILECLKKLTRHAEQMWPSGWGFSLPSDLDNVEDLPKSIVGFRLTADEVTFKKKLSQNRSEADRQGVINGLKTRQDHSSQMVLKDMLELANDKHSQK